MIEIPRALWISIAVLGAVTLIWVVAAAQTGSSALFVGVLLNVALLVGLLLGHKWAYVATLVFAPLGVIWAMRQNAEQAITVLIGNGLVLVPVIISTRFFFPSRSRNPDSEKPETERTQHPRVTDD